LRSEFVGLCSVASVFFSIFLQHFVALEKLEKRWVWGCGRRRDCVTDVRVLLRGQGCGVRVWQCGGRCGSGWRMNQILISSPIPIHPLTDTHIHAPTPSPYTPFPLPHPHPHPHPLTRTPLTQIHTHPPSPSHPHPTSISYIPTDSRFFFRNTDFSEL
jgi:hypothetical protein